MRLFEFDDSSTQSRKMLRDLLDWKRNRYCFCYPPIVLYIITNGSESPRVGSLPGL